jgi:hypothetical protein
MGNERTDGYASKLEAAVKRILDLRELAGEISDIKRGAVELTCGIKWNVDFNFIDNSTKKRVWCEAKGMETERYRICKKLWAGGFGPGDLEIWKGSWQKPCLVEVIKPSKKGR